ncbi:hypothetical protein HDU93_004627, partial [Gonapodya sp. JEL0774]
MSSLASEHIGLKYASLSGTQVAPSSGTAFLHLEAKTSRLFKAYLMDRKDPPNARFFTSTPRPVLPPLIKTVFSIGVGVTVFNYAQPHTFLGLILGYGSYRLIKSFLDSRFPSSPWDQLAARNVPFPGTLTIPFLFSIPFRAVFRAVGSQTQLSSQVEELAVNRLRSWVQSTSAPKDLKELILMGNPPDIIASPLHSVRVASSELRGVGPLASERSSTRINIAFGVMTVWRSKQALVTVDATASESGEITLNRIVISEEIFFVGGDTWEVPLHGGPDTID